MANSRQRSSATLPQSGEQAVRAAAPWVERLARLGFAAIGVVYCTIGLLAVDVALGRGGQTTDTHGALGTIVLQPFGKLLLAVIALGLIGYALWRVLQGTLDLEGQGRDAAALVKRAGAVFGGIAYAGLAISAIQLLAGHRGGTTGAADWTARLLDHRWGQLVVVLAGLIVLGMAGAELYQSYSVSFQRDLSLASLRPDQRRLVITAGRSGLAARGVVFGVIGLFAIQAAVRHDPTRAQGFGGALGELAAGPGGKLLLGLVAVGLVAYGGYMLVRAVYGIVTVTRAERR